MFYIYIHVRTYFSNTMCCMYIQYKICIYNNRCNNKLLTNLMHIAYHLTAATDLRNSSYCSLHNVYNVCCTFVYIKCIQITMYTLDNMH